MNNQDLFVEWYIQQINPRTGKPYSEVSARTYINMIKRLVRAGLVGNNIFEVGTDGFLRQINRAQKQHPAQFAALENHGSLRNGITWWKRFLDAQAS